MSRRDAALRRNRSDWEDLAALDPLWAILSEPARQHGRWEPEAFFETGRCEVETLTASVGRHGRPKQHQRALDFGCGVGRLTRALARHFDEAVGIDISRQMIDQAKAYHAGVPNCTFHVNDAADLRLFPDEHFDLIYSNIALQHVERRRLILGYVREFVRVLRPDGIAVFQLPSSLRFRHRIQLRPRIYHALRRLGGEPGWLYRRLRLHPVRMQFLPEPKLISAVQDAGGVILEIQRRPVSSTVSTLYFVGRRSLLE